MVLDPGSLAFLPSDCVVLFLCTYVSDFTPQLGFDTLHTDSVLTCDLAVLLGLGLCCNVEQLVLATMSYRPCIICRRSTNRVGGRSVRRSFLLTPAFVEEHTFILDYIEHVDNSTEVSNRLLLVAYKCSMIKDYCKTRNTNYLINGFGLCFYGCLISFL